MLNLRRDVQFERHHQHPNRPSCLIQSPAVTRQRKWIRNIAMDVDSVALFSNSVNWRWLTCCLWPVDIKVLHHRSPATLGRRQRKSVRQTASKSLCPVVPTHRKSLRHHRRLLRLDLARHQTVAEDNVVIWAAVQLYCFNWTVWENPSVSRAFSFLVFAVQNPSPAITPSSPSSTSWLAAVITTTTTTIELLLRQQPNDLQQSIMIRSHLRWLLHQQQRVRLKLSSIPSSVQALNLRAYNLKVNGYTLLCMPRSFFLFCFFFSINLY